MNICDHALLYRLSEKVRQPPLTANQKGLRNGVNEVFRDQLAEGVRDIKRGNIDFSWVASEEWADEVVKLTEGNIAVEAAIGWGEGEGAIPSIRRVALGPFVDNPGAEQFVKDTTFKFANRLGRTTLQRINNHEAFRGGLLDALQSAGNIPEITKNFRDIFEGFEQANRAEMIARTESSRALHEGTLRAWSETGVVRAKEWDASNDACPFCSDMDGKIVDVNQDFFPEGGSLSVDDPNAPDDEPKQITLNFNYGNIGYPPLHPYCRCQILPVLIDV